MTADEFHIRTGSRSRFRRWWKEGEREFRLQIRPSSASREAASCRETVARARGCESELYHVTVESARASRSILFILFSY